jgi:hypothetical protein
MIASNKKQQAPRFAAAALVRIFFTTEPIGKSAHDQAIVDGSHTNIVRPMQG